MELNTGIITNALQEGVSESLPEHLSSLLLVLGSCCSISCFRVLFCRSFCLVVLFLLPLYCLFFFDLQLLRTPLVFSNCSYVCSTRKYQMASRGTCNFYVSWYFDLSIFSVTYAVYFRNVSFHPGF